jgi:hypothetical protein
MKKDRYGMQIDSGESRAAGVGPYEKQGPIKVSLVVYLISLILVALIIFILMLVQYLPGYRNNNKLSQVVKNSNVKMTVVIPMSETEKRKENPFTKEQRDRAAALFKNMGAKSATVLIEPQT